MVLSAKYFAVCQEPALSTMISTSWPWCQYQNARLPPKSVLPALFDCRQHTIHRSHYELSLLLKITILIVYATPGARLDTRYGRNIDQYESLLKSLSSLDRICVVYHFLYEHRWISNQACNMYHVNLLGDPVLFQNPCRSTVADPPNEAFS